MLKLDSKELDTNNYEIEIRKINGYATEYNKELNKMVQTDKWEALAFYLEFPYNDENLGLEFDTIKSNKELLKFPLNEYVNLNDYIDDGDVILHSDELDFLTFEEINFYLKRIDKENFALKINVNFEQEQLLSLDIKEYKFELELDFNISEVE